MTYTAANFDESGSSCCGLECAQINKVQRLVNKLKLKPSGSVLEIGFGFGFLASFLVNTSNASSVTAITLSRDQWQYAMDRYGHLASPNSKSLKYLYRDYRHYQDGKEKFDAVISVEMIEAIGHDQMDTYFETVSNSLVDGGRFVVQYGSASDWAFPDYYKQNGQYFPTFVVKHIFPGHFEPDEDELHAVAMKFGLQLVHSEKFGLHYAKTLKIWLTNLMSNKKRVVSMYGLEVFRKFAYYLAWSQAVYQTQILYEIQAVFVKSSDKDIGCNLDELIYSLHL